MGSTNSIDEGDWARIVDQIDLSPLAGRAFLLTGATGLIGRYIAGTIALANRRNGLRCRLVCIAHNRLPSRPGAESGVEWRRMDLSAPVQITDKFDYIFHGACYAQPSRWFADRPSLVGLNIGSTQQLLEVASRSEGAFLFCSSGEVYGNPPPELTPIPESYTGGPDPTSKRAIYGESKRLGEVLCSVYREDKGVRAYAARISHLYGPGIGLDDQRVFADFMRQAMNGQPIRLRDAGRAIKTLGYIGDAVAMILNILLRGHETIYNVGGSDRVTIAELAGKIARLAGGVPVIMPPVVENAPHIGTDAGITSLDISRYVSEFGAPSFTNLETGLGRMIEWNRWHAETETEAEIVTSH